MRCSRPPGDSPLVTVSERAVCERIWYPPGLRMVLESWGFCRSSACLHRTIDVEAATGSWNGYGRERLPQADAGAEPSGRTLGVQRAGRYQASAPMGESRVVPLHRLPIELV